MKNQFNPRTKKISSIGEELRFQREYYCYKNNISLPLKIDSTDKNRDERKCLQDVLYDFIYRNCGNNSELATSYDVLYAIENGKSKKKSDPYNPNSYFLRMYSLFKIYGFLDDMTILEILKDKYKLEPSFESSKKIIRTIEEENSLLNQINKNNVGEIIKINIKLGIIFISKDTFLKFTTKEERIKTGNAQYEHIKKLFPFMKIEKGNAEDWCSYKYNFTKEREILKDKMQKLDILERQCISLELGRDTQYIQEFISGTLHNISINTLIKTFEYFKMENEKFYNILKFIIDDFSGYSIKYSNMFK